MVTEAAMVTHCDPGKPSVESTNMSAAVASTPVGVLSVTLAVAQVVTPTQILQILLSQPVLEPLTHSMIPLHIGVSAVKAIIPPETWRWELRS